MVIGLGGLALLQTGVIYPPESLRLAGPAEVTTPGPAPPASADLSPQKPVPVPQLGGSERRYPAQDRLEQLRSALKESGGKDVLRHTARKAESKSHARKAESKSYAYKAKSKSNVRKAESKSQARKAESKSYAHKAKSRSNARKTHVASGTKPVVITFRFDPLRNRELYVARVHTGDKILMSVRPVGMADGRVTLAYTRNYDSKEGTLVKVKTRYPMVRGVGYYPYERGYYVIEMKIYPGNRWNIRPRSFV
jgi:hypothetical protein